MEELTELKNTLLVRVQELSSNPNEEALHDFRVGVRRFLSNAEIDKKSKKALKKIFRFSSPIRDIDTLISKLDNSDATFSPIKEMLISQNGANYDELLKLTEELNIKEVISNCTLNDEKPEEPFVITDEFGHFSKKLLELIKEDSLADKDELHELRKKLKKIRYRFEHTNKLPSGEAVGSFKHLQDILGFINDRHSWLKIIHGEEFSHIKAHKALSSLIKAEENSATENLRALFSKEFCELIKKKLFTD